MSDATKPFQLFDALDPATEAALRASISRWGVIVPVIVDMDGNILDGHHRSRIATELGMKYPTNRIQVNSREMGEEIARTLNTDRRHLTVEQRQQLVADLRAQGFSTRAIAGAVGVNDRTVRRDLSTAADAAVEPVAVTGLNGKTYAPTQPARAKVDTVEYEEDARQKAEAKAEAKAALQELRDDALLAQLAEQARIESEIRKAESERAVSDQLLDQLVQRVQSINVMNFNVIATSTNSTLLRHLNSAWNEAVVNIRNILENHQ